MATVGRSNIEITADTRKARRTLGDFFRDAENSGRQFAQVLNALDPLSRIDRDSRTASGGVNNLRDAARRLDASLNNLGGSNNLGEMNGDLSDAEQNMDDLRRRTGDVGDGLDDASREMRGFGDTAERETGSAEGSFGKLSNTMKTFAGVLAGVFAVDQVKDWFLTIVETTADLEALNGQYEQVMGGMKGETDKYLNEMATSWNKHPNQLKSAYMQYVALLKGKGVEEKEAHEMAKKYMDLTVDGNAFANEAMEDTVGRFAGMIKGEYDSVDSAMVNLTATQLDAIAKTEYQGRAFADLTTAEQELLKTNEALRQQDIAGVIGQGAREADSYQNNVAMLKETWKAFIAEYGGPAMAYANDSLKRGIEFLQGLGDKIEAAKQKIKPFIEGFKTLQDVIRDLLTDDGQEGRDLLKTLGFSEEMIMRMDGYAARFADFRWKISDMMTAFRGLFQDVGSDHFDVLARLGLSEDMIAKMMVFKANFSAFKHNISETFQGLLKMFQGDRSEGISLLWSLGFTEDFILKIDKFMGKVKSIAGTVSGAAAAIGAGLAEHGPKIFNSVKKFLIDIWPAVKAAVSGIATFVGGIVIQIAKFWQENGSQIMSAVSNVFNGIMKVIQFVMPVVLGIIKMVWGNIKGVIQGALDVILGAVKFFSGLFTGDFSKMWEGVKQMFMGAVKFIWNFVQLTFFGKILSGAKVFFLAFRGGFATVWTGIKALFTGGIGAAWATIKAGWAQISSATTTVFKGIWSFLSGTFNAIKTIITFAVKGYFNIIRGGWTLIFNTTKTVFMTVFNFIKGIFTSIRTSVSGSVSSILTKVRDTWNLLKTNTSGAFRDIFNGIKTKFTDIVNLAKGLPKRIGDGIGAMASKVSAGVTKVINKLASTLGKGVNGVIGGINGVLEKIGIDDKNFVSLWKVPQYAQGTKGHPGGWAQVNDGKGDNAGPELIINPDGSAGMLKGKNVIGNFEQGTQVISARNTRKLLAAIPKYDSGTGPLNAALGKGKELVTHLWEGGKNLGKKAVNAAIDVFDYIKKPEKLLDIVLSNLGFTKPSGSGFIANMAKGGWNKVKSGAVDFVKSKLADFGDDGGSAPGFGSLFGKSSSYGWRMHPILKKRIFHDGADYPAPSGTLIKAQAAGKVIQAAYHAIRGNFVRVQSGIMERIYQHNSRNLVDTGDMVRKGQGIGTVGSTGRSTGPHLHYEVKKNGKNINPQGFFKGGIVKAKQLAWVAEKGMEAIIPLVTNRSEGLDLWRQVGEHFGFNMDALLNPGAFNLNFAGNGVQGMQNMSAVGSQISQTFKPATKQSVSQPIRLTVSLPLNGRVIAEETFEITDELIEQNKDIKLKGRGK